MKPTKNNTKLTTNTPSANQVAGNDHSSKAGGQVNSATERIPFRWVLDIGVRGAVLRWIPWGRLTFTPVRETPGKLSDATMTAAKHMAYRSAPAAANVKHPVPTIGFPEVAPSGGDRDSPIRRRASCHSFRKSEAIAAFQQAGLQKAHNTLNQT